MRACEGCRRRKIKCDAATTNTWPCSACIRLKLHCVPPTVNYDRDFAGNQQQIYEPERVGYESGGSPEDDYHQQMSMQQNLAGPPRHNPSMYQPPPQYADGVGVYQSVPYASEASSSHNHMHYGNLQTPVGVLDHPYGSQNVYQNSSLAQQPHSDSPEAYEQDQYGQQNLADLLGDLRMSETGTGNSFYLLKQNRGSTCLTVF